jgi:hypothetical protein
MKIKKTRMSTEVRHSNYRHQARVEVVLDSLLDSVVPLQYASGSDAGWRAEDLFLRSWINFRAPWFIGVKKASDNDNQYRHTDFYFTLNFDGGYEIKIDVKASVNAKTEFLARHPETEERVIVLVVSKNMSEHCVRKATIGAIREWLSRHNKKLHTWFCNKKPQP